MIKIGTKQFSTGQAWDHRGRTELVQIFISYDGDAIKFLQFVYAEKGNIVLSDRPDGSYTGNNFSTVTLQYPDEFLTSLKGTYNFHKVTSIEFGTNLGRYGPFGQVYENDKNFNFQLGKHQPFGGFHGSIKWGVLESIGVYVKPIASFSKLNSIEPVGIIKAFLP